MTPSLALSWLLSVLLASSFLSLAAAQSATQNDVNTLNYALTLEHLENSFYQDALSQFSPAAFAAEGYDMTVYTNIQMVASDETAHVMLLTTAVNSVYPGTAVVPCTYSFNLTTVAGFLRLAALFESVGQSAYDGAINFITSAGYQQVAATIATVEGRHSAYLNLVSNYSSPFPNTFDPANTPATVIAAITPYIVSCTAPQLANIPVVRPSGVALNSNGVGTNHTGSSQTAVYTAQQAANDLLTLNYALILERFEYAFYSYVNSHFPASAFSSAANVYLTTILQHETIHVQTLAATIPLRGGTVYPNCTYVFSSITTPAQVFATAALLEATGVGAYDGAVNTITDTNLQQIAATIATVEARHAAILNLLVNASSSPFPTVPAAAGDGLDPAVRPNVTYALVLGTGLITCPFTPVFPSVLTTAGVLGDPAFTGFHNQHFQVHGIPNRLFNLLSTPTLQVNARFKMIKTGEAMTAGQMRQVRLLSEIKRGSSASSHSLPVTTAFSHDGTFLGDMGLKLQSHRVHVLAGAYATGFETVTLDGLALPVSSKPVKLTEATAVTRPSSHTLVIDTAEVSFVIVNSDGFFNIEQATLNMPESADMIIDGMLGQTADSKWVVRSTAAFKQHMIMDFLLQGDDLFSDDFVANQFGQAAAKDE